MLENGRYKCTLVLLLKVIKDIIRIDYNIYSNEMNEKEYQENSVLFYKLI